ncbi:MAG: hypothetical protein MK486_14110 [Gemmatimonadetes bacterium]|jgi:hypothetical protein|nr:hypothetical protein [Gemmatimonadota bacterium]HBE00005.1 hypothetical protein [Gemmatimonadota bacterium]
MKRMVLVLVGLVVFTASAQAQTVPEVIELVVGQSLPRFPGEATLIKWNADYTYETLREGSNTLVCYDCADERDRALFSAQCTSLANLDRVAQNRRFRVETEDAAGERAMIDAAEQAGTRVQPEYDSIWFRMDGADQASALLHATIAMPGATTESTGLSDNRRTGGVWLMDTGTSAAHLMIPGR